MNYKHVLPESGDLLAVVPHLSLQLSSAGRPVRQAAQLQLQVANLQH